MTDIDQELSDMLCAEDMVTLARRAGPFAQCLYILWRLEEQARHMASTKRAGSRVYQTWLDYASAYRIARSHIEKEMEGLK